MRVDETTNVQEPNSDQRLTDAGLNNGSSGVLSNHRRPDCQQLLEKKNSMKNPHSIQNNANCSDLMPSSDIKWDFSTSLRRARMYYNIKIENVSDHIVKIEDGEINPVGTENSVCETVKVPLKISDQRAREHCRENNLRSLIKTEPPVEE